MDENTVWMTRVSDNDARYIIVALAPDINKTVVIIGNENSVILINENTGWL